MVHLYACARRRGDVDSPPVAGSVSTAGTEQRGNGTTAEPGRIGGPANTTARHQHREGVRGDPGGARRLVRAARRRGARARRRERLRQEHAGQDPERRPHAGRRRRSSWPAWLVPSIARRARRRAAASSRSSRRCSSPRRARCSTTSGSASTASWRTRVSHAREASRAPSAMLDELLGRDARPRHGRRGALAVAIGRRAASCARSLREPKILILDEATSALDVATRDRLFAHGRPAARRGRRRHLHHAPDGRDRADRRPDHRHAVRRDRGRARRAGSGRRASSCG